MMLAATPPLAAAAGVADSRLLPAGTRIDEYEIVRPLGVGGFGIVYLALDRSLLRQVALKEFMPAELAARGPAGTVRPLAPDCAEPFEQALESFFNEARLLAPFNHPALVRVYRFWKANGTAYMAMQYCPGITLAAARKAMRAPPDEAWLRAFVEPVLDALERLHRAGVVHRDISPDNILLLPNGRPILLDFGSARRGGGTRSLTAVLKPNFSPIEQYGHEAGMPQGPWTDLYALGATVDFMLTGEAPTPAVLRVVNDLRTPLAAAGGSAYPGVGAKFLAAIDWTAAVAPTDRPQSVEALRRALGASAQPETAPPDAAPRTKQPGWRVLAASVLAACGALGVGAWALFPRTTTTVAIAPPPTIAPMAAPPHASAPVAVPRHALAPTGATSRPPASAVEATPVPAPVAPRATRATATATATAAKPDGTPAPAPRPELPKRPQATAMPMPTALRTSAGTEAHAVEAQSPSEACAGRSFFSRAICMSRQCQAAGSRLHPDCIDVRKTEEQRQRRMDR